MPTIEARVDRPYNESSQILTSITAKPIRSGFETNTKNNIREIIVSTRKRIPKNKPLWAWAQSTE